MQSFPDESLVLVGENIFHKSTQASLCRVSRRFQQILTPVLYREICLDNVTEKSLVNLSNPPENSHLRFVKRLVLGLSTVRASLNVGVSAGVATSSIMKLIPKLKSLRSFGLTGNIPSLMGEVVTPALLYGGNIRDISAPVEWS